MPLPLLGLLGTGLGYLGTAAASPAGQATIGALAPGAIRGIADWWRGPQQPGPEQQAQTNYLQQIQQPYNMGTQQRQQQLMNQFNQQIIPQLQNQYAGLGAGDTQNNLFGQAQNMAGANLATNLGALGEENAFQNNQLNQQRLGELGGYLGGQQRLGLEAQGLNQRGTIANQENMLRAMGLMQNYDIARQGEQNRRLDIRGRTYNNLGDQATQQMFDTIQHGPQAAGFWNAVNQLAQMGAGAVGAYQNPASVLRR